MPVSYSTLRARTTQLPDPTVSGTPENRPTLRTVLAALFETSEDHVQPLPVESVVFWLVEADRNCSLVGVTPQWHDDWDEATDPDQRRQMLLDRLVHHPQALNLTNLAATLCAASGIQVVAGSPIQVALTGVPARLVALAVLGEWWRREQVAGVTVDAALALLRLSGFPDMPMAHRVVRVPGAPTSFLT